MSSIVFVETTGLGVQAIEYAGNIGHDVTFVYSPRYDIMAPPAIRERARRQSNRSVLVDDISNLEDLTLRLRAAGVDLDKIDAVLTTLQMAAQPAANLAAAVGARGTPAEAVTAARDKARCREVLKQAAIPSVRFEVVTSASQAQAAAEVIGYPVIIKPACGAGKYITTIAESPAEIAEHFTQVPARLGEMPSAFAAELDDRFLVEELAVGTLYSAEVAADGQSILALATVRRKTGLENPVLELGCTLPSGLTADEEGELGDYAVRVCKALGLNFGMFHIEIMHTSAGFRLIEVNPRLAGGSIPESLGLIADRNILEILVDLYAGQPAPSEPLRCHTASCHRHLGAAADSATKDGLAADWFKAFRQKIHSGYANVGPGSRVKGMKANLDAFGMIRVVAETPEQAEMRCEQVLGGIEQALGFRLAPAAASPWQMRPHERPEVACEDENVNDRRLHRDLREGEGLRIRPHGDPGKGSPRRGS